MERWSCQEITWSTLPSDDGMFSVPWWLCQPSHFLDFSYCYPTNDRIKLPMGVINDSKRISWNACSEHLLQMHNRVFRVFSHLEYRPVSWLCHWFELEGVASSYCSSDANLWCNIWVISNDHLNTFRCFWLKKLRNLPRPNMCCLWYGLFNSVWCSWEYVLQLRRKFTMDFLTKKRCRWWILSDTNMLQMRKWSSASWNHLFLFS